VTLTLGLDWGGYNQKINLQGFWDAGARFVIFEQGPADDNGTPRLVQEARAIGYLVGLYSWNAATLGVQWQVDEFSRQIDTYKPDFWAMDYEQWWASWNGGNPTGLISPQQISDNGQAVIEGMVRRWAGKYLLVYAPQWFVDGYSPQSVKWLVQHPNWAASGPDYGLLAYGLTWAQISALTVRKCTNMTLKTYQTTTVANLAPALPAGLSAWDMWQYSSRIRTPNDATHYDYDVFAGSIDDLRAKCGLASATVPVLPTRDECIDDLLEKSGYKWQ